MKIGSLSGFLVNHYKSGLYRKIPVLMFGPVGIGKSSAAFQAAEALSKELGEELPVYDVRFSQLDSVDFRGIPGIVNGATKFNPPNILPFKGYGHNKRGILFCDEINLGDRLVRACGYQLILDRRIGDKEIEDGWMIIAAGNRTNDGCDVDDLPAALRNRFLIVNIESTVEDYSRYIGDPEDSTVKYLRANREALSGTVDNLTFATPRSWERVSKILKSYDKNEESLEEVLFGLIGSCAKDFIKFIRSSKGYEEKADEIISGKRFGPLSMEDISPVFELLCEKMKGDAEVSKRVLRYTKSLSAEKAAIAFEKFTKYDAISKQVGIECRSILEDIKKMFEGEADIPETKNEGSA